MKQLRKFALGVISAGILAMAPAVSSAETIQLGFILDRSGSVGASNWNVIVDGLSSAIGALIPVGGDNTYEISVVSFATAASIDITRVLVTDATVRTALATSIFNLGDGRSADVYTGGNTNYAAAFNSMQTVLSGSTNVSFGDDSKSYVNFATDGEPNTGGTGIPELNALISAGVDNISIEGIGISTTGATNLQNNYCYPQPCTASPTPFDFPTQGFYIGVADAAGYAAAIGNKIRIVTNQVPEPTSIALVGLALLGAGVARRRVAKR